MTGEIGIEAKALGTLLPSAGSARIRSLQSRERVGNALRTLGTLWGIGLCCVLLPIIHFVLVPLLFCLGIYFAAGIAAVRGVLVSGSVPCPGCRKPFVLEPGLARWPVSGVCPHCRRDLEINPGSEPEKALAA